MSLEYRYCRLLELYIVCGIIWSPIFASSYGVHSDNRNQTCEDFGTCSQLCVDSEKGFTCSCIEGFHLNQNGWGCKPTDGTWKLIYSTEESVEVISKSRTRAIKTNITQDEGRPVMTTFDARNNFVYWTDATSYNEAIYRASLAEGPDIDVVADSGLQLPEGIAFDWITGNIYFADSNASRIAVCTNVSSICAVLIQEELDKPRDIALNPNEGIMFWTDWGVLPVIVRAGMDGRHPLQIVSTDLKWPNGITVDQGNMRIYWADAGLDKIESSRFDGTDRKIVISSKETLHPFSLDIFGDSIFWSDWRSHEIVSANKVNGSDVTVQVFDPHTLLNGLAVFHIANQPVTRSNTCASANCSHICTIGPSMSFKCICPVGMQLGADRNTCLESDDAKKLVVAYKDAIYTMAIGAFGKEVFQRTSLQMKVKSISDIVYNPVNHTLVIFDSASKKIYSYQLHNGQLSLLVDSHLDMVQALDIDVVGENLYWADNGKNTIEVMSFRTGAKVLIREGVSIITCILIDSQTSTLYMVQSGDIYKMPLNGFSPSIVQRVEGKGPTFLSYDWESGVTLLTDKHYLVDSVSSNGTLVISVIATDLSIASDVIKVGNYLYYTDKFSQKLNVLNVAFNNSSPRRIWWERSGQVSSSGTQMLTKMTLIDRDLSSLETILSRHDCAINNPNKLRCSHLCILTGVEFVGVCVCPEGMTLGKDGINCTYNSTCQPNEFACNNRNCIPMNYICDGKADCGDSEDERDCARYLCLPNYFKCNTSGTCISKHWVCNGQSDCEGGEDENNCTHACLTEMYSTCKKTRLCIPKSWMCDGNVDCLEDGSDEESCGAIVSISKTTSIPPLSHRTLPSQETTTTISVSLLPMAETPLNAGSTHCNKIEKDSSSAVVVVLLILVIVFLLGVIIAPQCTQIRVTSERAGTQQCIKPRYIVNSGNGDDCVESFSENIDNSQKETSVGSSELMNAGRIVKRSPSLENIYSKKYNVTSLVDMDTTNSDLEASTSDQGNHFVSFKDTEKLIHSNVIKDKSAARVD